MGQYTRKAPHMLPYCYASPLATGFGHCQRQKGGIAPERPLV